MEDLTAKTSSLREAKARAVILVSHPNTVSAVVENRVPKGNVLEMARVAGLFGVKNTFLNLPNSQQTSIEFTEISYDIQEREIHIQVLVKSICKTDLEIEALHGATIVALTIYDMLKPIDKGISIGQIRIGEKPTKPPIRPASKPVHAALVLCSNAIIKGIKPDSAGQNILKQLEAHNIQVGSYEILPDDLELIRAKAKTLVSENQLVVFCGGTGLSKTDVTTEALEPLMERKIPGIEEAMRSYGQQRTPHAMFSRSLAGMVGDCMVLALPGSTRGAEESMEAVFPHILHVLRP